MPVTPRLSAFAPRGCPPGAARRITRRFHRLSASGWWVAYALRTRPPLSRPPKGPLPFDLHVLGLPLAFILSQDQTLRCIIVFSSFSLSHGLRFVFSSPSQVPFTPQPHPLGLQPRACAGLKLSKIVPQNLPALRPSLLRFAGAKVQPFP